MKRAFEMMPYVMTKDEELSKRAGYPIYVPVKVELRTPYNQIADLGCRVEVLIDGESTNIWIVEPKYTEFQIADALEQINEASYQFEDKVYYLLAAEIGISQEIWQRAFKKCYELLKEDYPDSKLIKEYGLDEY